MKHAKLDCIHKALIVVVAISTVVSVYLTNIFPEVKEKIPEGLYYFFSILYYILAFVLVVKSTMLWIELNKKK